MSSLVTTLSGYLGYRGREGQWSFLLHRITGLGTGLFLTIHILDTSFCLFCSQPVHGGHQDLPIHNCRAGGDCAGLLRAVSRVNACASHIFDLFSAKNWSIPSERKTFWWTLGSALGYGYRQPALCCSISLK